MTILFISRKKVSLENIRLVFDKSNLNVSFEKEGKETNKSLVVHQGKNLFRANRKDLVKNIRRKLRRDRIEIHRYDENKWIDYANGHIYNSDMLFREILPNYSDQLDIFESNFQMPNIPEVYIIREQRLLRKVEQTRKRYYDEYDDKEATNYGETIEEYSQELKTYITNTLASYSQITQQLDSSFPKRLFDEQYDISKESFDARFEKIKDVQKALNKYGLSVIKEDNHPTYKAENAKALTVYLEDTEKKLDVFILMRRIRSTLSGFS